MSANFQADVAQSMGAANRAFELYAFAMQVFQANAQRHKFDDAEAERANMHPLLDDYLDHFLAANKRVKVEADGGKR